MTERVDVGWGALATRVDGPADAPWLILSNSLGTTHAMWEVQMPALSQRYRVLRYDTRGHGASDVPNAPFTFADLEDDVLRLMDRYEINRAAFMGLSMGGMTGLGLAINHGDRIARVVCADARADAPAPFKAMWDERIAKVEAGGMAAIADGTLGTWLTEDFRQSDPDATQRMREMLLASPTAGYIACCKALKQLDYLKDLGRISAPALFVGGASDPGAAPAVMREMAEATPGGRYVEIPGAAHIANVNAPAAYLDAISEFLSLG